MELRVPDTQKTFTADAAAQAVDYWRTASQSLPAGSDNPGDSEVLNTYSKMAVSQAKLLADHNFTAEAEQTYRLATDMAPSAPEAVFCYAGFLASQKRFAEAIPVVETAVNAAPDNQQFRDLLQNLKRVAAKN
jgi:Tfp pilus assembly protein PilF